MQAQLISTTNERLKYFEGKIYPLIIERQAFFGSLYTSRLKTVEFVTVPEDKCTQVITTLNSTYIFELV